MDREGPGTGTEVSQNSQKFRVGARMLYPYPHPQPGIFKRVYPYLGYCGHGRTELTQVQGTRMNVVQNLLTEVPGTGSSPGYGSVRTLHNTNLEYTI